jgi:ABC-2 type transport system ATP-binding protein
MKQKLALARALVHSPEILFLDEPTSGLDPRSAKDIRDLMEELSERENQTILLSTHRLEDAERLCSRVMIIRDGESLIVGSPDELRRRMTGSPFLEVRLRRVDEGIIRSIRTLEQVSNLSIDDDANKMTVGLKDLEEATPLVVRRIVEAGGLILSVEALEPSLEEAYLKLVGGEAE